MRVRGLIPFFFTVVFVLSVRADLPATYDLRSAGPGGVSLVPAVQNQGDMQDCWTFATATALDSYLLKNGFLPTGLTAPEVVVSSWHLSLYNGQPQETAYVPGDGPNDEWGQWGGFYWQSMAYLTRGSGSWAIPGAGPGEIPNMGGGPVSVTGTTAAQNAFPLQAVNDHEDMSGYLPPVNQPTTFRTSAVHFYNQTGSGRTLEQQVTKVKQALHDHGAVATYMYAGGYTLDDHEEQVFQKVGDVMYAYLPEAQSEWLDHAVTIIGWDDTVQVPGASGTGAWIVQNSWGEWGGTLANHDGTFYAAYEDKYIGRYATSFQARLMDDSYPVVLQNELGPIYQTSEAILADNGFGKIASSRSDRAVSLLDTEGALSLLEIGLYSFMAGTEATLSIYGEWSAGLGPSDLLYSDTVSFTEIGYTSFLLDDPVDLSLLTSLVVEIDYNASDLPYVWWGMGDTGDPVPEGLTFFYDEGTGEWVDFASLSGDDTAGVFFLKGLTAVPEPQAVLLLLISVGFLVVVRRPRQITPGRLGRP